LRNPGEGEKKAPMRATSILWLLALGGALAACAGAPPPEPEEVPDPEGTTVEMVQDDGPEARLAKLNQQARSGAVTETIHGVEVSDPFRALEEDTPATRAWIDAQSARTIEALRPEDDRTRIDRLDALLSIGVVGGPAVGGERVFYTKREGDREQPALFVAGPEGPSGEPLVDPQTHGERAALDWFTPSPRGRYVAFGISHNGDERSTLHIVEVEGRRVLDERIPRTKWSNVEWLNDESGFYYTRYPKPEEPGFDAENEDSYFPRVFFHRVGTDPAEDPLVFGSERGTDFPGTSVSEDDRFLVITVFRGWSASDVYLFDRGRRPPTRIVAPTAERPLVPVIAGEEHLTTGMVHGGKLYLATNKDAPRYRIVTVLPARAGEQAAWQELIPETEWPIEGWAIAGGQLAVHYIEDVHSRLKLFRTNGRAEGEVELPARGELYGLAAAPRGSLLAFGFSSYLVPPALFTYDVRRRDLRRLDQVVADFDFSPYTLTLERVRSEDGVEIPVQLLHRRDAERNGRNPVLLSGYGGFNQAMLPAFARNALYWLEQGGIYAVANLRGGSEFGEDWHRAGMLENKENCFEDFEAVTRWLAESGWSSPERIAITGGSNGGLLMGAMITRAPETFRATASYVGLYDMVRYHRFPPAELWVTEYGSAEDPEQFRVLHGYSPYHHVEEGTRYPSILIETADHDSRVYWGHSTKFAAALQEANGSARPIYFYMERQVGHGAGTRRSDLVSRYARFYTFLERELGLD
jgi:prolyl oligopeptidase